MDSKQPRTNDYHFACGCAYPRDKIRMTRTTRGSRYYCPTHARKGPATHRVTFCKVCDVCIEFPVDSKRIPNWCDLCREKRYAIKRVPARLYDCTHYEDCLYHGPTQILFDCTRCDDYIEESPELKIKRNAQLVADVSSSEQNHLELYHSEPYRWSNKINDKDSKNPSK